MNIVALLIVNRIRIKVLLRTIYRKKGSTTNKRNETLRESWNIVFHWIT